jgi:hypothetical protein|tara:strand:+ start:106082 stop:106351 length:270 start_codon:yes stop_codon:yes gene_type:complete
MDNEKVITGSANITLEGASIHATGTVTEAIDRIEASSKIPEDMKQAIKDFIHEKYNEIQEYAFDLMDFPVPDTIADWWPLIVDLLKPLL